MKLKLLCKLGIKLVDGQWQPWQGVFAMNATYELIPVNVFHNGQYRLCYLHVVKPENQEPQYFLKDYYGWSIDDANLVAEAVRQYNNQKSPV